MWPSTAYFYAVLITRYRLALEACFRRLDALLEELKASGRQQHSQNLTKFSVHNEHEGA